MDGIMRVALPGIAVTIFVVVAVGTGGNAVALTAADQGSPRPMATEPGEGAVSNVSLGAHLSAFMQANAAQTSDSVETEMWAAGYANATTTSSRKTIAISHRERLERRIEELRADKQALTEAMENGTISRVAYHARLGRLVGRLVALEHAFRVANRTNAPGLNRSELQELRHRAAGLAGEDVSGMARGLRPSAGEGGPPDWLENTEQGPPDIDESGPSSPGPPVNVSSSEAAGNESGPPGNNGPGHGNGDSGQGDGSSGDGGPGKGR